MATTTQINSRIELAVTKAEKTQEAYLKVLSSEGQQDIKLSDGTFTSNLNKRLADHVNRVKSVAGKTGDVTSQDIKDSLNLGSAADYNVNDLPVPQGVDGRIQTAINNLNLGSASQKDVEFFAEQEKQADKVILGNGRTVESKLSDNPNPIDFGAKGDGVTDDTQAFTDFEKSVQGREIDLLGKTYLVDSLPSNNTYKNGNFFVNDGVTLTIKPSKNTSSRKTAWQSGSSGALIGRLDHKTYPKNTGANIKVSQGTCYDFKTNEFFTLMVDGYNAKQHYIEKHNLTRRVNVLRTESAKTVDINHQGLDLCYINGVRKFFSVGGVESNYDVIQFEWDGLADSAFTNKKVFKLFPDNINNGIEIGIDKTIPNTMGISPNGQILATSNHYILKGNKSGCYVRIFDVNTLNESGDYSDDYLFEFPIHRKYADFNTIQAIATDGEFVYVMQANEDKSIDVHVYTLDGTLVQYESNSKIGFSFNIGSNSYEPETFVWIPSPQGVQLAVGNHTWKSNTDSDQVTTNIVTPQHYGSTVFNSINSESPAIITNSIGYDNEKNLTIYTNWSASPIERIKIDNSDVQVSSASQHAFFKIKNNGTSGNCGYDFENSIRKGRLYVSSSGNLGLYDLTKNAWVLYSNTNGDTIYAESKISLNGSIYPRSTEQSECGTDSLKWKRVTSTEFAFSQNVYMTSGFGSPEGVVTANAGSMYINKSGGAGQTLWVKETGTGNTGWVAK